MNMMASRLDDSRSKMAAALRAEKAQTGRAPDAYFYRSPLVYETELTELVFRSWLYAGHVSELASPGDYLLLEIGEDSLIIVRDDDGGIREHSGHQGRAAGHGDGVRDGHAHGPSPDELGHRDQRGDPRGCCRADHRAGAAPGDHLRRRHPEDGEILQLLSDDAESGGD